MSFQIEDDRGEARPFTPAKAHMASWDTKHAARMLQGGSLSNVLWGSVGSLGGFILCQVFQVGGLRTANLKLIGVMVCFTAVISFSMYLIHRRYRRGRTLEVRRTCIKRGICPACAYDMARLVPESDGCRICPECGGAWRLPDTVSGTSHA